MSLKKATVSQPADAAVLYQLKIVLLGIKPLIWRRLQVHGDMNLGLLHAVLQVAMGWTNSHLHTFVIGEERYTHPSMSSDLNWEGGSDRDESKTPLQIAVPQAKTRFIYEYDFGDSWEHGLVVEKILPWPDTAKHWAVCLDGWRACPPEDCGGIWGYSDFLKAIKNPRHPEHAEMLNWIGGSFDPEAFDLEHVNRCLRLLKWPRTSETQLAGVLRFRDERWGLVKDPKAARTR